MGYHLLLLGLVLLLGTLLKLRLDPDNTAFSCPDPNCKCGYKKVDPSRFVRIRK